MGLIPWSLARTRQTAKQIGTPAQVKEPKLETFLQDSLCQSAEAILRKWSRRWDLNPQPTDYKSVVLPIELRMQISYK